LIYSRKERAKMEIILQKFSSRKGKSQDGKNSAEYSSRK
jgi:hypothetical protein